MVAILVLLLVLAVMGFIAWAIVRTVRNKGIKAHNISYWLAIITGMFTYGYILSLDFPILIKVVASIFLGIVLIIFGAMYQRRRSPG
jgi:ABC-type iron transport system FetAB permease component